MHRAGEFGAWPATCPRVVSSHSCAVNHPQKLSNDLSFEPDEPLMVQLDESIALSWVHGRAVAKGTQARVEFVSAETA